MVLLAPKEVAMAVYVHANLALKEKALAKIQPMDTPFRRFRPDDRLLAFLESL